MTSKELSKLSKDLRPTLPGSGAPGVQAFALLEIAAQLARQNDLTEKAQAAQERFIERALKLAEPILYPKPFKPFLTICPPPKGKKITVRRGRR